MADKNLFVFGYGFSSFEIVRQSLGDFHSIVCTNRSNKPDAEPWEAKLTKVIFDGETVTDDVRAYLLNATHLLISIAPDEGGDPALRAIESILASSVNLRWIGYLSTVGVYGNHDGRWVDETSTCYPVSKRSKWRVAAETAWSEQAKKLGARLGIFRLSGIYGPGRNAFVNLQKGTARRLVKPGQVFNRVHREDIGQAVKRAMSGAHSGVFNITDDEPAPPQDVVVFAHHLAGKEPPPEVDFEQAELSPMARSFYGENKRVSNQKSKDVLGIDYRYPNYRSALNTLWEEEKWQ